MQVLLQDEMGGWESERLQTLGWLGRGLTEISTICLKNIWFPFESISIVKRSTRHSQCSSSESWFLPVSGYT